MKFVNGWFGAPSAAIAIADLLCESRRFRERPLLMASLAAETSKLAGTNLVHELVHSALSAVGLYGSFCGGEQQGWSRRRLIFLECTKMHLWTRKKRRLLPGKTLQSRAEECGPASSHNFR